MIRCRTPPSMPTNDELMWALYSLLTRHHTLISHHTFGLHRRDRRHHARWGRTWRWPTGDPRGRIRNGRPRRRRMTSCARCETSPPPLRTQSMPSDRNHGPRRFHAFKGGLDADADDDHLVNALDRLSSALRDRRCSRTWRSSRGPSRRRASLGSSPRRCVR